MAQRQSARQRLGITDAEYKQYQAIRKARNQVLKDIKETTPYRNMSFLDKASPLWKVEKQGKRMTLNNFKSRHMFEEFIKYGEKYTNYGSYIEKKAKEYTYNFRQALDNMGASQDQLSRFDKIVDSLDNTYYLDEIYSWNEELDLSYVYTEVKEQGTERIDMTLDVLEALVDRANTKNDVSNLMEAVKKR